MCCWRAAPPVPSRWAGWLSLAEREPLRLYCVAATQDDRRRVFASSAVNAPGSRDSAPVCWRSCGRASSVPLTPLCNSRLVGYRGSILRLLFTFGMTWRAQTTAAPAEHKAPVPGPRLFPPFCTFSADRSRVMPVVCGHGSRVCFRSAAIMSVCHRVALRLAGIDGEGAGLLLIARSGVWPDCLACLGLMTKLVIVVQDCVIMLCEVWSPRTGHVISGCFCLTRGYVQDFRQLNSKQFQGNDLLFGHKRKILAASILFSFFLSFSHYLIVSFFCYCNTPFPLSSWCRCCLSDNVWLLPHPSESCTALQIILPEHQCGCLSILAHRSSSVILATFCQTQSRHGWLFIFWNMLGSLWMLQHWLHSPFILTFFLFWWKWR